MSNPVPDEPARAGENLELKARVADLDVARGVAEAIGAVRQGTERQVDRFFPVPGGRLKLRRSTLDGDHLIAYLRRDAPGARISRFHRLAVPDPDALEATLGAILGAGARVEKEREVWWWRDVRIHFDRVAGLGSFLELEARLDRIGDRGEAASRVETLRRAFGVGDADRIAGSYAEMLADGR